MQSIDTIRLSEKQKQQLILLKRKTGIENWNVLCRWALCLSLADPTPPPKEDIPSDSNVEMSWKVFSGADSDIYESLLKMRYSLDTNTVKISDSLKQHISRGIHYLNNSSVF